MPTAPSLANELVIPFQGVLPDKIPAENSHLDCLNWDVSIEVAPPRPHGTIQATIICAGRGRPAPISDPR